MDSLQRIGAYGVGGVCLEVLFTSTKDSLINGDPKLQGYTQLWVLPLYALGGRYVFEPIHDRLREYPTPMRAAAYATAFFAIEGVAGLALKQMTGECPWSYTGWGSVYEVVRLTHAPVWMSLGLVAETYYKCLQEYRIEQASQEGETTLSQICRQAHDSLSHLRQYLPF